MTVLRSATNTSFSNWTNLPGQRVKLPGNRITQRLIEEWSTYSPLLHHFFHMPVAQWIGCVPTDAHQNHVYWEAHPSGSQHLASSLFSQSVQHSHACCVTSHATKPGAENMGENTYSV